MINTNLQYLINQKSMIEGKVYKIIHKTVDMGVICYVGSTTDPLKQRFSQHRLAYTKWVNGEQRCLSTIYPHFKKYGIDNFEIVLIKKYIVCDTKHLKSKEQLWMSKLKCCNRYSSFQPIPRNILVKMYRDKTKEQKAITDKKYRENNKDKLNQKILCECGETIPKCGLKRHQKTKKHCERLNIDYKQFTTECECGETISKRELKDHLKTKKHCERLNIDYGQFTIKCEVCGEIIAKSYLKEHQKKHC
jgi:hypothetical protein